MIIAADTRSLTADSAAAFVHEAVLNIAAGDPAQQFILFTAKALPAPKKNITYIAVGTLSKNLLLQKLWYDYKLPALLKKHKAAVFIGPGIISARTKIPQSLAIADLQTEGKSHAGFFKKWLPVFLKKAGSIIISSNIDKNRIVEEHKISPAKVSVAYPAADTFYRPISWEERESVKEQYAAGKEYFLYTGKINEPGNLINLLKAFSFFKKRQKSNMQLLIATTAVEKKNPFLLSLQNYKYRNDVQLLYDIDTAVLAKITASAYAAVNLSAKAVNSAAVHALQCGIPVIIQDTAIMQEFFGEAALYTDFDSFEGIAQQLMLVFKDEAQRSALIEKGRLELQKFQPGSNAASFYETIIKTTG